MKETEQQTELLREMVDLLRLLAEPQLAERDRKWRDELRKIAGKGDKNISAVKLMNGTRSQSTIAKEIPMDVGQLSKLVKSLRGADLLTSNINPEVVIPVTDTIFQEK